MFMDKTLWCLHHLKPFTVAVGWDYRKQKSTMLRLETANNKDLIREKLFLFDGYA